MASGTFEINGQDVVAALTERAARTNFELRLNRDGERLAALIAAQVMERITKAFDAEDKKIS